MRNRLLAVAAAAILPFAAVSAQQKALPANVLSFQPLNAMLTIYSAEYERRVGTSMTFGVGGTYWDAGSEDNVKYNSGDIKLRYYPSGQALAGFSLGASAGFASVTGNDGAGTERTEGVPSFGVLLEYQWLMGQTNSFGLALGAGAKKLFIEEADVANVVVAYPTARVSIGWAF
jgi:hypothetical protein